MSSEYIDLRDLLETIENQTKIVKEKLEEIRDKGSNISIQDMFEMQILMNHLSQLSDMSSSVVYALNQAIINMARNLKG